MQRKWDCPFHSTKNYALLQMKTPNIVLADTAVVLSRRPYPGALVALFILTMRQLIRGRRLLVVSLLFALPCVLAAVVNLAFRHAPPVESTQFALIFNLIPHALAPLAALLYATGIIQDEVEEQTLTYLLLRPMPRWAIYLTKLLATILMTSVLTAIFTTATFAVIALTAHVPVNLEMFQLALKTAGLLALVQVGYCGFFGLLGLLMRRSLLVGVAYIVIFEGIFASLDTVARRLTVMYYFNVLVLRWMDPVGGKDWSIDLTTAPEAQTCVLTLLFAGLVLAVAAALIFNGREFRMKTPEGN
jgi:ABC-2 type transport system permease protein